MKVRVFRKDGVAVAEDVALVLVETEDGTPVSVSWQRVATDKTTAILTAHAGEQDFAAVLQQLGLSSTSLPLTPTR